MGGHTNLGRSAPFGVMVGEWVTCDHDDGLVQWRKVEPWPARYFVEARNKEPWFVVDRHPPEVWRNSLYPPVISGPYEDLDAAKAAYVMTLAAQDE